MSIGGLFISEYVEGSDFNNAIEIYNNTGEAQDLSQSQIEIYLSGATDVSSVIQLQGTLEAGETYVLANSLADAEVLGAAEQLSNALLFDGNDAIALRFDGQILDSFGQIGFDPGLSWPPGNFAIDASLRRLPTEIVGDPFPNAFFEFDERWERVAGDAFDDLGDHAVSGGVATTSALVEVFLDGEQADALTGPRVPIGETITWDIVLTNTGATILGFTLPAFSGDVSPSIPNPIDRDDDGSPAGDDPDETDANIIGDGVFSAGEQRFFRVASTAESGQIEHTFGYGGFDIFGETFEATPATAYYLGVVTQEIIGDVVDDILDGAGSDDTIFGRGGDDIIIGRNGWDDLRGGDDDDIVRGGDGNDLLSGDAGRDTLRGGAGDDVLDGGDGGVEGDEQILAGDRGNDVIQGGDGVDVIRGGADDDEGRGGGGNDRVVGDRGNDLLFGEDGDDVVLGALGDDIINGGEGADRLIGGGLNAQGGLSFGGADVFVFEEGTGRDVVLDFEDGTDLLDVSDYGFTDVQPLVDGATVAASGGIVVDLGGGDAILLRGLALNQLDEADFIFA